MNKVILCGHTGSFNHGCEAIIKSTADLLHNRENTIVGLATHDLDGDKKFGIKEFEECYEYINFQNAPFKRWISVGFSRLLKAKGLANRIVQKPVWNRLSKVDIVFNVGGDTYCYSRPYPSIYLNRYCEKNNIKNILWACSIEENIVRDEYIRKDLDRYAKIYPRETLTYNALIDVGYPKEKLFLTCDPAFTLDMEQIGLPVGFLDKATVGINLSPTVLAYSNDAKEVIASYKKIIEHILSQTNYNVALIPHVYNGGTEDLQALSVLYETYKDNRRVVLIKDDLNCRQLKYLISRCIFLVTARTHASIAGYSTFVPTLVIGYSVKAKGIAIDLFGDYQNYVFPVQDITDSDKVLGCFLTLFNKRAAIENHLRKHIPGYIIKTKDAVKDLFESVII